MIGLINAVGTVEASRSPEHRRDVNSAAARMTEKAPILSAEQAANRVLNSAVEAIQFLQVAQEQSAHTGGTQPTYERAGPAATETAPRPADWTDPGQILDVTG